MSGNEDSRVALERWYDVVDKASWRNFSEIKVDFPATDYVGNQHYVFNMGFGRIADFLFGHYWRVHRKNLF